MKSIKEYNKSINESLNEGKTYVTATDAEENVFLVKEYPNEKAAIKDVYYDGTGDYTDLTDKYQDVMDNGFYITVTDKKPSKVLKKEYPKYALKESEEINEMLGFKDEEEQVFISNPFFDSTGRYDNNPDSYKQYKGSDLQKAVEAAESFVKSYTYWKEHSISQEDEDGKYDEDAMYLDFYLKKNKKNLQTLLKFAK